jgi:hypothetical protein
MNNKKADAQKSANEKMIGPGQSLGIASVPNLRDMGGYTTSDGATVARGLVYRTNELHPISPDDIVILAVTVCIDQMAHGGR